MNVIIFYILIFIATMPSYQTAPEKDIVVSTKEEIAKIYACEDKDGSTKPIVTRGTAAVFATSDILSAGSRNMDAAKVMDAAMEVICNPESSITARKAAMKDMETVQEYLRHSGNALIAAAKHSAPVAGFKKAHQDEERKKLRDAKATINASMKKRKNQPKKLPEALLLDDYVKQKKGEASSLARAQVVSPDDKRLTRSSTSIQSTTSIYDKAKLPKPQNGTSYTKPEVISVIENALQDTSQGKAPTQRQVMMTINSAGYIPVQQRSVERLMKKHRSGDVILDTPWGGGTVKAVPDDIVVKTAESIRNGTNEGLDMQHTAKKMITDVRAGRQEKAGLVPDPKDPSHSTVDKYVLKMVQQGASIVDNVISKTETRSTNEKSERGPISNVAIVGTTQFEVMDEEDRELNTQLENASFQTRALYELVRRARGGAPIWAIRPQLLFSTDDTTAYIFDGKAGNEGKWVFASDRAIKNRGTQSIYRQEKVNMMNGVRVKVTFTFSGAGMTAPLFITVSGLSEEEMPNDEFLHVQVPGLAVGGVGVTVGNNTMGHIFFMRKGKGADEERVKYYQDEILLPWIEEVRKGIDSNYNYIAGMNVTTKMKAVSWMDGALDQVASIADNPEKFADRGITVCKQNPGRTAVEQPADLAPVFKLFKKYVADTSSLDRHVTKLFRDKLDKAFKTDDDLAGLKLKRNHHNALIDFLAICASAATKACTLTNVIKGWTESGLLDRDERGSRFPVLAKILATCKKAEGIKASLVDKVSDDFPSLLNEVDNYGRLSEEWFEKHKYPRDQNKNGEDVLRNDSSAQEHMQRSKVMTHEYQVTSRLEVIHAKIAKQRSKLVSNNEAHEAMVASNKRTVKQLCNLAGQPVSEENLVHCTLEHFAHKSIHSPDLYDFIKARDETIKMKKDVASTKGKLESAKNGDDCRILHAFNVRSKRNRIEGEIPHNLDEFDMQTRPTKRQRPNIRTVTLLDGSKEVKASNLLDDDEWFKYLVHLFDMSTTMENVVVTEEQKKNADVLAVMLRIRLKNHINNPNRVGSEAKRNHWVWDWAEKNLPICAAYLILAGHVKPNFQNVNDEDSLLSSDSNKFIPINRFPNRHGVYLNNDTKMHQAIRSGKKTSFGDKVEGFAVRMEQHKKGCSASNPTSNFYKLYPSNSSGRSRNISKQGVYEDLEHIIAVSYDPKGDAAQKVNLDCRGGGIMILNSQDVQRVKSSMPTKPYTEIVKFQLLLSYLFELAYDLAIAPSFNVSESPGFESFGMINV